MESFIFHSRAAYGLQETISSDDRFYTYCNRVFSGWDFCINDVRAAHLKHKNIKHELEVGLAVVIIYSGEC